MDLRTALVTLLIVTLVATVALVVYGRAHPCEDCWKRMEHQANRGPVDVPLGPTAGGP